MISYGLTKYLNLTVIAIVSNLAPLFTVVLAYMILKEKLKSFELTIMLLSLVCVILFSVFATSEEDSHRAKTSTPMWVLYASLATSPVLIAGGNIAMRKMKKFHNAVVAWYQSWAVLLVSITVILITQEGFEVFKTFDWRSWVLISLIGFFAVLSLTTRFKALKLQKAAKLQILTPIITLLQFAYDVIIDPKFTWIQYASIGFLFFLYVIQGVKVLVDENKRDKKKKARAESRAMSRAASKASGG